jgi:hypothetical protein
MARPPRALVLLLAAVPAVAAAQGHEPMEDEDVPAELRPFVEPGTRALAIERADLDGDGRPDVLLVLQKQKASEPDAGMPERERPLLILTRQPDGSLKQAARNDKVVYCSTCGGMMGDPFMGITPGPRAFTVEHYGGSGWRWSVAFTFGYSRRDGAWQLVKVDSSSFHASEPDKVDKKVERPPRDFGKIDFADFDPDDYAGKGPR